MPTISFTDIDYLNFYSQLVTVSQQGTVGSVEITVPVTFSVSS